MNVEIIEKSNQKTTKWSGGTTTELYIYPSASQYSKGNFLFRISWAFCRDEITTFTSLPGVERILMVLDGQVRLKHVEHYASKLDAFEQDTFLGDWETISHGSCTDFNLMLRNNCKGRIKRILLCEAQEENIVLIQEDMCGFYILEGNAEIVCKHQGYMCKQEDFIMFSKEEEKNIDIVLKSKSVRCIMIQVVVEKP